MFMYIWGFHIADILIVIAYLIAMVLIGKFLAKTIKGQLDFYLAGRKLGKVLQFFLNFGAMTDAIGAPTVASEVYRQGLGGSWLMLQYVFNTPFFWFVKVWWRRARVVTLGDFLSQRFNSKSCGTLFAIYAIIFYMVIIGFGNVTCYAIVRAMVVKPAEKYSAEEKQMVADFDEYQQLRAQYESGTLQEAKIERFNMLRDMHQQGRLHSFVSYLENPLWFYIIYSAVVGAYMVLGGFMAAVITDAVQGILIVIFSVMLIPFGLHQLGGFAGMRAAIPEGMTRIFGSATLSEYTWYSIIAILITTLVGWFSSAHEITISGSAKDEFSARLGAVTGGFAKRLMTLAWIFCALIALALWPGGRISNPDLTWGILCRNLLAPGFLGLMLVGILAGNMSTISAAIITASALFVRNAYSTVVSKRSDMHYVLMGRLAAVAVLIMGIVVAMISTGIIPLFKVMLTLPAIFGSVVLLSVLWRRLTKMALLIEVSVCLVLIGILPYVLPAFPGFRRLPQLLLQTQQQEVTVVAAAAEADVQAGLANEAGQTIKKKHVIQPASVFFESVAHVDPTDTDSPLEGVGRFNMEIYLVSRLGVPVQSFSKAGLLTTRFAFCTLFPFALLFVISYLTKPTEKTLLDRFYVRMKTPVVPIPEEDAMEMEKSRANPHRFDHQKVFPNSNWEFCKWDRQDTVGFLLCWVGVAGIMFLLWLMANAIR